jgi:alkanesulfonate monooxygenase SsuD/methylene tetrahydromethanopterin reductase-like flavin-dependent oxidoreductase (luciferase family)
MRPPTLPAGVATVPEVRWGLSISLAGDLAGPGLVAEVAVAAEQAGWDGVFVWDHLWNAGLAPFADPWVTLAAIAAATERVTIGTMVAALSRRRPQLVAQATTTLDRLSGGRMVLGVGLGVDSYGEYSAFAEPVADDRARAAAADAAIELLLPMLAGDPVPGAEGRVTTVPGVRQPRVPIWVAGRAGLMAGPRRVARHGLDGLALVGGEVWGPADVTAALTAGGLSAGVLDVVLVGGTHPDPAALAAAGATWCMPEILPGATAAEALTLAATRP